MLAAAALLAVLPAVTGILPSGPGGVAHADEVTASQDLLRTGWDFSEPAAGLSPSVVSSGSFGQLFSTAVDGQVYAQPIVAGSTVIVATENDWVYGLDAVTGAVTWSVSLGTPWPSASEHCTDLTPNVGVTSTPVYDPATHTVYLVAQTVPPGGDVYHPVFSLIGLDAQTGAITGKVPIGGAPVNDPTVPFNSFTELQRPALLMMNGWVYAAFGSHCDFTPYAGYVAGVNVSTQQVTLWSDEAGLTDNMAGVWQAGGGLVSDGAGRIFFATGNGVSPAPGPGTSPPPELAEAVVRLAVGGDGSLSAQDFFSPANAPALDAADTDLGSGGPVGLPVGTAAYPSLLVQAGKDGRVFVLNRDNLGGREQAAGGGDAVLSEAGPFSGQWGHPAVFEASASPLTAGASGLDDYVYYLGASDSLRALQLSADGSGRPILTDVAASAVKFGYTSGSPVVTSNGTDPSSAVVWVVGADNGGGGHGTLYAFDAIPQLVNGALQLQQIWSAPIGTASKFAIAATDNGHVYVATRDGHVLGFGSPDAAPLTGASPLSFTTPAGGTGQMQTATLTATGTVTLSQPTTSASGATNPFSAGQATVTPAGTSTPSPVASYPVTLNAGDVLSVPVTFGPATPGAVTGSLAIGTDAANFPTVNVSLSGNGTQDGLAAAPASLAFGTTGAVPVGTSAPMTVSITNTGTTSASITKVTPPAAPFTAAGLPAKGATIPAGGSIVVRVTYTPTASGNATGSFGIQGSTGTVTVNLTGTAVAGISRLSPSPATVSFGSVPLGQRASATVDISNTGNLPATLESASVPDAPFGAPQPVTAGLPLNPGYDLQVPVTFTPTSLGAASWTYRLTWTDPKGTHSVSVPVTGTGVAAAAGTQAIVPPGGGWRLNGNARVIGTSLRLTSNTPNVAGSAIYPVAVPSDGLTASFTAQIGGGTGADGMTFSLLKPSGAGPASLGGKGGLLGFGRLPGAAVVLATHKEAGFPSGNFAGVATGITGGHLKFAATSSKIPRLRTGSHTIKVTVSAGTIRVWVDGKRYLSTVVKLPKKVLAGFTAATGAGTDNHVASGVAITAGGTALPPPGGGWSFNSAAGMAASATRLTAAAQNQAGAAVYPAAVPAQGLRVAFDAQLSGGTGADGLTFALLNPADSTATSVGGDGGNLGFGGLDGVAFTLATKRIGTASGSNFAGLSTGTNPQTGVLGFQVRALGIGPLRTGTHPVTVQVVANAGGTDVLVVTLDGEQIFAQPEPQLNTWQTVRLAFTASTDTGTDRHIVRDVAISVPG